MWSKMRVPAAIWISCSVDVSKSQKENSKVWPSNTLEDRCACWEGEVAFSYKFIPRLVWKITEDPTFKMKLRSTSLQLRLYSFTSCSSMMITARIFFFKGSWWKLKKNWRLFWCCQQAAMFFLLFIFYEWCTTYWKLSVIMWRSES